MKNLKYLVSVDAPISNVYRELFSKKNFDKWATAFGPGNTYSGTVADGEEVTFIGEEPGALLAKVSMITDEFIKFTFIAYFDENGEKTPDEEGQFELYEFEDTGDTTLLTITASVDEEYFDEINNAWKQAIVEIEKIFNHK